MLMKADSLAHSPADYLPHSDGTPSHHAVLQYKGIQRMGEVKEIHPDHILLYQIEPEVGFRRFNIDRIESDIELTAIA